MIDALEILQNECDRLRAQLRERDEQVRLLEIRVIREVAGAYNNGRNHEINTISWVLDRFDQVLSSDNGPISDGGRLTVSSIRDVLRQARRKFGEVAKGTGSGITPAK